MTSWATLVWNSTDSLEFHGGTVKFTGSRQGMQLFPQDDSQPYWHDPNRRVRLIVITGTFHSSTWTRWHEEAFVATSNSTYPYLVLYQHWNATSSSVETAQVKVVLKDFEAIPMQNGERYSYNFVYAERT